MAFIQDYYEILGVPRTANDAEIKNLSASSRANFIPTWRRTKSAPKKNLRKSTRPTKSCPTPAKRKKYDELGANWKQGAEFRPPPGYENFGGNHFADSAGRAGGF